MEVGNIYIERDKKRVQFGHLYSNGPQSGTLRMAFLALLENLWEMQILRPYSRLIH